MTRRRYVYSRELKAMVEVTPDWSDAERRAPVATEEATYGNLGTATDGTPINSRAKHREYMRAHDLALTSDFEGVWHKAEAERADFYSGKRPVPGLKAAIGRAVEQVKGRKS